MKTFDYYEFTGVLTPGVVALYIFSRISPASAPFIHDAKDFTLGQLGLFVILAYVAGHLVQALGNLVEKMFWKPFGGMPTNWLLQKRQKLLSDAQVAALPDKVEELTGVTLSKAISDLADRDWFPITRQMYAAVAAAGRAQRVDTFNGNYGLFRGVGTACLLCAGFNMVIHGPAGWPLSVGLLIAAILALARMFRFGRHYARELFVQFLQVDRGRAATP